MSLKEKFPLTHSMLGNLDDSEFYLEHIANLETGWKNRAIKKTDSIPDSGSAESNYDVFLAGGGLSLLYAISLAKEGFKVCVADKLKVGTAHREWNISYGELNAFTSASIFSPEEIDDLINLRYERGIVNWHGGKEHSVTDVLDCAMDAKRLLVLLRSKAIEAGIEILDHHSVCSITTKKQGVSISLEDKRGKKRLISSRLVLDGRGSQSGNGQFDIVCPTVGGVLSGLDHGDGDRQVNPFVGEILVSLEGIEEGKQHIWEGFPTANKCMTTYLFYYTSPENLEENPLFSLYERFFSKLDTYKTGEAKVVKPTYGFIPGNTRLTKCDLSPQDRVYLVGDASGQHSPLTFCGFGSIVRSFQSISSQLGACLSQDKLDRKTLNGVECGMSGLRVMGGLAIMMIADRLSSDSDRQCINALLEDAFSILSSRGQDMYRDFMQDQIAFREFIPFMLEIAKRRPSVWTEVYSRMSHRELKEYFTQLTKFGFSDLRK